MDFRKRRMNARGNQVKVLNDPVTVNGEFVFENPLQDICEKEKMSVDL